jgi:hypothetical protein
MMILGFAMIFAHIMANPIIIINQRLIVCSALAVMVKQTALK